VEDATVYMRYMQHGVYSPNEVRRKLGEPPREDDGGNVYYYPSNVGISGAESDGNMAGEPDTSPDDPARTPTDDEYPDSANVLKELRLWRKHVLRAMDGKRSYRKFQRRLLPVELYQTLDSIIDQSNAVQDADFEFIKNLFAAAEEVVRRGYQSGGEALAVS